MSENLIESGVITEWSVKPTENGERLVFTLKGRKYSCFDEVAAAGKEIFVNNQKQPIKVEYYDKVSGNITFHNVKKIEKTTETQPVQTDSQPVQEQVIGTEINGFEFGLACKQAGFAMGECMKNMIDEDWNNYKALVKAFYKCNKMIRDSL